MKVCVKYAGILMQIKFWVLSHPDYISTDLSVTQIGTSFVVKTL